MEPGGAFMDDYVAAKLREIDAALAELDDGRDVVRSHAARKHLVALQARLIATLTTFSDSPPSLN
jgi:hypothetical protein